jgi:hypothetical protein
MSLIIANESATFQSGKYNPNSMFQQQPMICRFVNITIPGDWMKYVIGKNAHYFNAITYQSGTTYIWYHNHINMIEIWGPSTQTLDNAETRLIERMTYICVNMLTKSGMWKNNTPVKKVLWGDIEDIDQELVV